MRSARVKQILSVVLATALLTGCASISTTNSATAEINISQSDVEAIFVAPAKVPKQLRIIALANGSAEIVAAMGMRDFLVGRDVASSEKFLERVPVVTSGHQVIPERVIALRPDVVLIDSATGPASAIDVLKKSKIKLSIIDDAWTLADISKKIMAIGGAIGEVETARVLNQKISQSISNAQLKTDVHPRIAFLYLRGTSSIYLMGGPGSGADSLIRAIGAIDVGADSLPHAFNSLTSEALVKARPDILLVMTKGLGSVGGIDGLMSLPGVAQTPAGKSRRVISVDDSLLLSFGPRTPALLSRLAVDVSRAMNS
ncbi:MAG: ABC transporter substrate-binding protein [Actinobacteria bacterium]|nr:ABC transporter substrate-binding protein [Actinomycetota bacterium]